MGEIIESSKKTMILEESSGTYTVLVKATSSNTYVGLECTTNEEAKRLSDMIEDCVISVHI